ncbi:sulfurtransferase, partial [Vibrio sp.]|uniref:sulfurtransferase n=1 Tax=Vibrio sp. TaxID=678 RepID=UPI003D0B7F37
PFSQLIDGHLLKPAEQLQLAFDQLALSRDQPMIFSCGSGVTACILLLAAYQLGIERLSVYDGSWTEWGAADHLPIETGPNGD